MWTRLSVHAMARRGALPSAPLLAGANSIMLAPPFTPSRAHSTSPVTTRDRPLSRGAACGSSARRARLAQAATSSFSDLLRLGSSATGMPRSSTICPAAKIAGSSRRRCISRGCWEGRAVQDLWISPARHERSPVGLRRRGERRAPRTLSGRRRQPLWHHAARLRSQDRRRWPVTWWNPVTGVVRASSDAASVSQIVQHGVRCRGSSDSLGLRRPAGRSLLTGAANARQDGGH